MKRCLTCGFLAGPSEPTCPKCGEASWSWSKPIGEKPAKPDSKRVTVRRRRKTEPVPDSAPESQPDTKREAE
jgi:hypothetical protein